MKPMLRGVSGISRNKDNTQAFPWKWDPHGNPMGNLPWNGREQHAFHFQWKIWDRNWRAGNKKFVE